MKKYKNHQIIISKLLKEYIAGLRYDMSNGKEAGDVETDEFDLDDSLDSEDLEFNF